VSIHPGVQPHDAHKHFVRFYDDDTALMGEVAGFLAPALGAGGTGVAIASGEHLDALRCALGPDSAAGRLVLLDAGQALARFMVDGWPDEQLFNDSIGALMEGACGGGQVHAFGEMVAVLCAEGHYDAALRVEELWNDLGKRLHFSLFCAYPWHLFPTAELAEVFERVCAEHDHACSHSRPDALRAPRDMALQLVTLEQKALALGGEVARRRQVEQSLVRQERDFADFVENAAEGLHRVGADGTILWANKAELQMLGYRWEEYVGRHIAEFHVDKPVINDIIARLKSGATLYDQPARLRCKDGSVKHVVIHSNGFFEDGRLQYTRCFTRDATERRERDEALAQRDRVLLNLPAAAALLAGPDFTFRLVNRRFCELAGRSALEGKDLATACPGLAGAELLELLALARRTAQPTGSEALRAVLPAGDGIEDERFFKVSVEPLTIALGQAQDLILVAVDVTEQVRTRRALERAQVEREALLAELTAAAHAKDEFLAMLGHELRNPLSPIVSALQLMRLRGEPGAVQERAIIQRQVDHLVRLVDDLLDVARVTRGKIELRCQRIDIAQPLAKAVEMANQLLERRGHRFELDIERGLDWEGDPVRLAQVVSNLLSNAARYTDPGGHIALRAARDGAGWLRISVTDNGIGLEPDMLAAVFGLFVQGQRSIARSEGGLGIGLALVKNIVELHGGTVEAHSEGKGKGSAFIVRLPLASGGAGAGLVVDDNVDAALMLGRLFEAHGHVVEVFHDGLGALASAQRFLPDIAVLDIGLPGLDGYQLAVRLREQLGAHPCRLIALTGYGQDADRLRSSAAGFEQHLIKPIGAEQVARIATTASPSH
jgi:PAS domain S-box-containing protein